jgi:lactoylglutathione lyase
VATIGRPHHTGIAVSDLERSVRFYRDILGFELTFAWNPRAEYIETLIGYPGADVHSAILRMPDSDVFLELMEIRDVAKRAVDTGTANPGVAHICFFTDDCDGLYAELTARGVAAVSAPVTPTIGPNEGGRAVYMLDPDGVRLEFVQTPRSFGDYAAAGRDGDP